MTVTYCVLCDIDLLKLNVKTFLAFRQETKTGSLVKKEFQKTERLRFPRDRIHSAVSSQKQNLSFSSPDTVFIGAMQNNFSGF